VAAPALAGTATLLRFRPATFSSGRRSSALHRRYAAKKDLLRAFCHHGPQWFIAEAE